MLKKSDKILKAINSPIRIEILKYLLKGPSCVTLTNKEINISQPNLSQHLKTLKAADLIDSKKKMNKRCYYIKDQVSVKELLNILDKLSENKNEQLGDQ